MEISVIYKNMEVTYGELANALRHLNYRNVSTDKEFVYVNSDFDSIILLPLKNEKEAVNKARFSTISFILSQKGVINHEHDLAKMIENARLRGQQASA